MKIYLAGNRGKELFEKFNFDFLRLDSFYYIRNSKWAGEVIKRYKDYMLDSGAFTFIMEQRRGKKISVDIDSFTEQYIKFINKYDVEKFYEMDVDKVFGYEKVLELRKKIEQGTGKRCIPVFHMGRGLDEWKKLCKEYDYIAIGVGGKDFSYTDHKAFNKFVQYGRSKGVKVHGLGITGMTVLKEVPFYSVDSSSWTAGNRYKSVYKFDGKVCKPIKVDLRKKSIKNHNLLAEHNLKQWILFSNSMLTKETI